MEDENEFSRIFNAAKDSNKVEPVPNGLGEIEGWPEPVRVIATRFGGIGNDDILVESEGVETVKDGDKVDNVFIPVLSVDWSNFEYVEDEDCDAKELELRERTGKPSVWLMVEGS